MVRRTTPPFLLQARNLLLRGLNVYVMRRTASIHQQKHRLVVCTSQRLLVLFDAGYGLTVDFLNDVATLEISGGRRTYRVDVRDDDAVSSSG